jgi:hypothetical protein
MYESYFYPHLGALATDRRQRQGEVIPSILVQNIGEFLIKNVVPLLLFLGGAGRRRPKDVGDGLSAVEYVQAPAFYFIISSKR